VNARSIALALLVAACGSTTTAPVTAPEAARVVAPIAAAPTASASAANPAPSAPARPAPDAAVAASLAAVAAHRKLPIREDVAVHSLDRAGLLARVTAKLREEVPPGVVAAQGDFLRVLGLVPADYDLEAGMLALLQGRVAGFYDPDARELVLLDDLSPAQRDEALPHELVHALQDQSFALGPMLDFVPGESDRLAARQLLVEGDATLAGLGFTYGPENELDPDAIRLAFHASTVLSDVGRRTPAVLVASLVAPYTDGFAFAQALVRRGGTAAIDAAFARLPVSTEQALHLDKYTANELPLEVAPPTFAALGADFEPVLVDVNGELGLRVMLEPWTSRDRAARAAAGWGGDRLVVARASEPGRERVASAIVTRMDSIDEAVELGGALYAKWSRPCTERADLGPLAWRRVGDRVVVLAGPFERRDGRLASAGDCALATRWLDELAPKKGR
jgi:hypothetical protein